MQLNKCEERFAKAYSGIEAAVKDWEKLDGPLVNGRKALSEGLVEAIEDAINETADIGAAGEVRTFGEDSFEVVFLFDALAEAYREYKRKACAAISLAEIEVDGDANLWRAINSLQGWFSAKYNYFPPPAIEVLRQQGVGDEQIARIYGWFDEDGEPDLFAVADEERNPGKHYDPATWVHPAKRKRIEIARAAIANRITREREYVREADFGRTTPPSLDELVRLGAPASQIAALHGLEVEDAEALLRARPVDAGDDQEAARLQRDTESAVAGKGKKAKV